MSKQRVDRETIRQAIIEEAEYWDKTDTADMMGQETEWFTFEWTEREDRCRRCGAIMERQTVDLQLVGGRVTLRDVPLYICRTPRCGQAELPPRIVSLADRVEAVVKEGLAAERVHPVRTHPVEPVAVREVPPLYPDED